MHNRLKKYFHLMVFIVLFACIHSSCALQAKSPLTPLEKKLQKDIEDLRLDDFSRIEAAFILSGVYRPDSLRFYEGWYNHLIDQIRGYPFDKFDYAKAASQVFSYLHTTWLKTYRRESTDLLSIVHQKEYNCVAATILYNLICDDMGWTTEAFETPTHVYTIFTNFTQEIAVENTSPMGFNIMRNPQAYSQYLAQYYHETDANRIGLDRLHAYESNGGRIINNTELLGLLAYNRAYFARGKDDYAKAYELVLLAQSFNSDSRSNVAFEKNLYFIWGRKLFNENRFNEAFSVFADAIYRYPDMSDFRQNTRAAFYQCLSQNWQVKDWKDTRRIFDEIRVLDVLQSEDLSRLQGIFHQWNIYFQSISDQSHAEEVNECLHHIAAYSQN